MWNPGASDELDLEEVKEQEHAKQGMEVAAPGSHKPLRE
jgi:predicted ATPase with chaperone activity